MGLIPKSKNRKRLENVFSEEISEPKISVRRGARNARARAVEAVVSRVEPKIDPTVAKRLQRAEQAKNAALDKKEEAAAAKKAKDAATESERQARLAARQACTCRNPRLDKNGKCTRCKKFPAAKKRGRFG